MLSSRAIIKWLHSLGGAKGVKSQPIWGVVCYIFSAGNRAMHLEDLSGCLDDNRVTFAWARVHSGSLSWLYICLHDTPQNVTPVWVTPAWAHPGCCTRVRISLRYHVNAKPPLVLAWNWSVGRLEWVAHALFCVILNHTCILSTWSVSSNNEIWNDSVIIRAVNRGQ